MYDDDSVDPALHPPPELLDEIHAVLPDGTVVWPQRDGLTLSFDYDLPDRTRVVAGDSTLYVVKDEDDDET